MIRVFLGTGLAVMAAILLGLIVLPPVAPTRSIPT